MAAKHAGWIRSCSGRSRGDGLERAEVGAPRFSAGRPMDHRARQLGIFTPTPSHLAQQAMISATKPDLPRGGRFILGVLIFGVVTTLAYWLVWFGIDRELLASAH